MIAPLAKLIDWSVFQICFAMLPQSVWREAASERDLKMQQAVQFLNGPDFMSAESQPAQLDFGPDAPGERFRFPTPRPCEFAENNVVHGRLYRCADAWQERPVIVLLHGGSDFPGNQFIFHVFARRCQRAGFNAATLELPYHFQRRPRQYGPVSLICQYHPLISRDYLQMAKTSAQAVAEIRSLSGWLLAEGCPAVAWWGFLGAYLAGLTVCRDARLAAAVLSIPGGRLYPFIEERAIWRSSHGALPGKRAALEMLNRTALNLATIQPVIPKENILLIDAIHYLMVPKEVTKELWQAWGRPDLWQLPHGHISSAA